MTNVRKKVAVLGAGPAGLTAAYLLCEAGHKVVVFEKDAQYVGVSQERNHTRAITSILGVTVSFQVGRSGGILDNYFVQ